MTRLPGAATAAPTDAGAEPDGAARECEVGESRTPRGDVPVRPPLVRDSSTSIVPSGCVAATAAHRDAGVSGPEGRGAEAREVGSPAIRTGRGEEAIATPRREASRVSRTRARRRRCPTREHRPGESNGSARRRRSRTEESREKGSERLNRGSSSSTTPTRLLRAGGSLAYHGDRSSRVYGDDDVERRERARGILREIRKTRRVRETAAADRFSRMRFRTRAARRSSRRRHPRLAGRRRRR